MSCESIEEHLSAYIDGELRWDERMAVERHLQECFGCRKIIHDFEEISKTVYEVFDIVDAPVNAEKLVTQRIVLIRQRIQTRRLSLVYLGCAVFGLIVILSISISPVGHILRASIRLFVALVHGSINLLSVVGNIWFAMIGVTMLAVFGLSFIGCLRLIRKIQSEALL